MVATSRPDGLRTWTDLCALVDSVRIAINRDLQAEAGLTLAENLVLCRVGMAPHHRMRMVDLAQTLNVAKSAVTKTVDRLEDRGLLTRTRDPRDRRGVYATLTSLGERAFATAQPSYANAVERHFAAHLNQGQLQAVQKAADRALAQL